MKQEDKYIDYLFDSVREEAPQISFEETAEVFSAATSPTLFSLSKRWFLKNINLNSILFLSATMLGIIAFFLSSSSNNFAQNTLVKNQIVTNQIEESSSTKNINLELEEKSSNISSPKKSNNPTAKNIKPTSKILKPKTEYQQFNKNIIPESPLLFSISLEIKSEIIQKIPLAPSVRFIEKEKIITDDQRKYKTTEKVFSPWVVGQESEMPWKIKRQYRTPILNETERVIQQFLETKYLEQIFEKEENGYFKPLKMLVYYSINENYLVHFKGERIRLVNEKISPDFDLNEPFIDVKKFKIKKTKAFFNFTYKDYQVQMQLRRVGEGWKRHKLKVKKNKELLTNISY
ncbi:MAG: hypothetical protein AB8H03_21710 [Saprospiraceae bacterium]